MHFKTRMSRVSGAVLLKKTEEILDAAIRSEWRFHVKSNISNTAVK